MSIYQLTQDQEALYEEGGWPELRLLETINESLDRRGAQGPVAVVAADGMAVLFWLTGDRR